MAEKISATRAKQGRWGVPVLLVLIFGLALAGLAWFGVELYGEKIDTSSDQQPGAVETVTPPANPGPSPSPAP